VVQGVGVFFFAYVCQMNGVEVYWDMRPEIRSVRSFTLASFIGMMICAVLYLFVCVFGYMDFGSTALSKDPMLRLYHPLSEP